MIASLLLGFSYGFAAGVSPGPMLGLVITQTLRRGWRAGNLVALAPLFSDMPIILLAILIVGQLPHIALGWLGVAGGLFVVYLGIESIRAARGEIDSAPGAGTPSLEAVGRPRAVLGRAVLTNLLNPHPYLFWATAGAQLLLRAAANEGTVGAALFLIGFYALLVGSKLLIALIVNQSRGWLGGRGHRRVLVGSGVLLAGLGLLLAFDGARSLLAAN